uniref:Uncharacterized protein n=1 Tax=Angiostrongylus cantonensis TaxID=6313 RepID=A0A0K0D4E3_ANGCA
MFYNGLVAVMKRVGAKASDPYDWERPDAVNYIQQHVKDPYAWENAAGFFQSDPIKVNSPPPGKSRRRKPSNLSKLISVDTNTKKLTSQATSTSTDAEKVNIPSEQTLREMQEKLSILYGVKEESSSRQKNVLKGFLGTNLPPLESKPVNKEKRKEREREKEIKQQPREDDLNEVAKEAKLKMRLDERRKDPKKQETIMKTQNATDGSKEPMVERQAPGKKQKATVDKKKRNA